MNQIDEIVNRMTDEEKASLGSGKDFWHTKGIEHLGVPSVMMCDGPNGLRKQKSGGDHMGINESIEAVCFPTASAMASSFDRSLLEKLGETLGEECRAENIAMLLGPGVNIKRSPLCGRNFEYFSEDPYAAGELGSAYVKGLQSKGISACVKHFAANNQEENRMNGDMRVDERSLNEIYFPAFCKVVKKGKVKSVMCSYNKINGTYSSENKKLLTDTLREKWGFDGFVVTDWGAGKDRVKGIEAGVDLVMPALSSGSDEKVSDAVKNGKLQKELLTESAKRMVKFALEGTAVPQAAVSPASDWKAADHALSGEMEKECAVLLKNEGGLLPLDPAKKAVFIGEFAAKPRYQGSGSSHINTKNIVSILDAMQNRPYTYVPGYSTSENKTDEALLQEAVKAAGAADCAVIFAGLPESFETEGADRENMDLPENQNALIEAVASVQPRTSVVLMTGSPVILPWLSRVQSVLNLYLGGEDVGDAAVSLLYGEANPSGKLSESWPLRMEDASAYLNFPGAKCRTEYREGIFVGYRYYDKKHMDVQFPFGFGLSYTDYDYSCLEIESVENKAISDRSEERLRVRCRIKNTGIRSGKEAVQLYLGIRKSTELRPVKELRGFEKIRLEPGEERSVEFVLTGEDLAYYDEDIHDFRIETGEYTIGIGASSRDIRLEGTVCVQGEEESLPVSRDTTIGQLMQTEKGRRVMQNLMVRKKADSKTQTIDNHELGEGSSRMVEKMMNEMPLGAVVTFGQMSEDELTQLLALLNSD